MFVDLIEPNGLYLVADLAVSGKRHDLAQVGIAAPERAVKGLFARNPRKQRDIDAVADQPHINIVAARRQQLERQLHHLRSTRAIDDRIEFALTRGVPEFLADVSRRLVFDADDMIGPVLLCDDELLGTTGKCDHGRAAPKELGVLNGVRAQSTDTEYTE